MSIIVTTEVVLETTTCITCGVTYGMPTDLMDYHRRQGDTHYCPNGHGQSFIEPEIPKLKKQLRQAKDEAYLERQARYKAEKDLDGALDKISKMKKRANAGLCPYCRRHFVNVERHIKCKHKDKVT